MTNSYLRDLETECLAAVAILRKERYYEYIDPILRLIEQAKHYQQLTESMIAGITGVTPEEDNRNLERARDNNTWYSHREDDREKP